MNEATGLDVENVVVLVGDAVRWDFTHDTLSRRGVTARTVAASYHTPTAFATMFSGLHPPAHGISGFRHQLSTSIDSIFDLESHSTAFSPDNANDWICNQQQIFGKIEQQPLEEMTPPFVWVNRHPGGHAPYDDFGAGSSDQTVAQYFNERGASRDDLAEDYQDAIETFLGDVDETIAVLDERDLTEDTLVVVTSDHGELLGEHGHVGHSFPNAPELAYVPTTLIHPSIEPGVVEGGVARHVDLLPTLLDVLENPPGTALPGQSLFSSGLSEWGASFYDRSFADFARIGLPSIDLFHDVVEAAPAWPLTLRGIWGESGGHGFNESSMVAQMLASSIAAFGSPEGQYIRQQKSYWRAHRTLSASHRTFGEPSFSEERARELISNITGVDLNGDQKNEEKPLDEQTREQLREMGYI